MISVSAGYGTDGSSTPTIVAGRSPRRIVLPSTVGSLLSAVVQKRCVSTAAPAALRAVVAALSRRPEHRPQAHHLEVGAVDDARAHARGSPRPIIVNVMVENCPSAGRVFRWSFMSGSSGTENVEFSTRLPGALWRM
jgi:hypothetical protein